MKKLILKTLIFLFPFLTYLFVCYTIDPFCYFDNCSNKDKKELIIKQLNEPLWKILNAKNSIKPNVYLGSSKMELFDANSMKLITEKEFTNLAFGGGSLEEQIKLFWMLQDNNIIENIYFEVDLLLYNENNKRDRVTGIKSLIKNPFLYFFNYNVFEGIIAYLKHKNNTQVNKNHKLPIKTIEKKELFWQEQLDEALVRYMDIYKFPEDYEKQFFDIKKAAVKKDIKLNFVFCPVHEDIPNIVFGTKYNLLSTKNKIISQLSKVGTVYDAGQYNSITRNKDNFGDPFHIKSEILSKYYISRIFSDSSISHTDSIVAIYKN